MLARKPMPVVAGFGEIVAILKQVGKWPISEGNASDRLAGDRACLGDAAPAIEFVDKLLKRFKSDIACKDRPPGLGFGVVDDQPLVFHVVTQWHTATGPFPFFA